MKIKIKLIGKDNKTVIMKTVPNHKFNDHREVFSYVCNMHHRGLLTGKKSCWLYTIYIDFFTDDWESMGYFTEIKGVLDGKD